MAEGFHSGTVIHTEAMGGFIRWDNVGMGCDFVWYGHSAFEGMPNPKVGERVQFTFATLNAMLDVPEHGTGSRPVRQSGGIAGRVIRHPLPTSKGPTLPKRDTSDPLDDTHEPEEGTVISVDSDGNATILADRRHNGERVHVVMHFNRYRGRGDIRMEQRVTFLIRRRLADDVRPIVPEIVHA